MLIICLKNDYRCPYEGETNVLNCRIVVSKSERQLSYYIHFQINTLMKGIGPLIISYLPTPPLGQDMTQGQFLSMV